MSRGLSPRVNSYRGPLWILLAVILAANVIEVNSYSCHEVKTAFQLRQVGPLSRVPETPRTGERPTFLSAQTRLGGHTFRSFFNIATLELFYI